MTAKSLFAKVRDAALALGQSDRTAARKARLLESASFADFLRLTPKQNAKLGLSPKARHYVLKDTKRVTKGKPTISARQYETKKARELFGLSPEQAMEARRQRAISYVSAERASASKRRRSRARKTESSPKSRSCARPAS